MPAGSRRDATPASCSRTPRTRRSWAESEDPVQLRGLFHIAAASERIADAARDMTRLVEGDEPPHPELSIHTSTGMEVLAVERAGRWTWRRAPVVAVG